jgi:hypothetical protein
MDRRTFIGAVVAALGAVPLAAQTQPATRRRIGFLGNESIRPPSLGSVVGCSGILRTKAGNAALRDAPPHHRGGAVVARYFHTLEESSHGDR